MFGFGSSAKTYAQVGLTTDLMANDPHKLIELLFDGAIQAVVAAQTAEAGPRGALVSRAMAIISDGLKASLANHEDALTQNLDALYDYMIRRLWDGNTKGDSAALVEVAQLLGDLKTAWDSIPLDQRKKA